MRVACLPKSRNCKYQFCLIIRTIRKSYLVSLFLQLLQGDVIGSDSSLLSFVYFVNFRAPDELNTEYDPAGVAFKPSVPVPRNTIKKASANNNCTSSNLEQYFNAVDVDDLFVGEHVDFYKAYKSNL